jgi:predicted outer membrane repeat protein
MIFRSKPLFNVFTILALLASLLGSAIFVTPSRASGLCYVNINATGTNTGNTWTNAYTSLQLAIADTCTEIWVAAGIYKPHASDRTVSFVLESNGVEIYGGFAGTETLRSERDFVGNVTILSGDLNGNDNSNISAGEPTRSENSYHVIKSAGVLGNSVLDGFTITGGNANTINSSTGSYSNYTGGGMYNHYSNPILTNLIFSHNSAVQYGGGVYNKNSNPTLTNVTFSGNSASNSGGGIFNATGALGEPSNPILNNVTFNGNSAGNKGGGMSNSGAIALYQSGPILTNVTFSGNSARYEGGGMSNNSSSPTLTNVTFSGNSSTHDDGGGMYNDNSNATLVNVTFNSNSAYKGGGMANERSSPTLTNVTFSGNSATTFGGGMFIGEGPGGEPSNPILKNVIIANSSSGGDCVLFGTLNASSSNNLIESTGANACGLTNGANGNIIGSDPNLGTLTGSPAYFPLNVGSPAIDAGTNSGCPATDQRGVARPQGSLCDIGAFEYIPPPPLVTNINDSGPGSLRQIIANASNGATITFDPSIAGQTIHLEETIMIVNKDLTIDGSGLASNIKVSGDNTDDGVGDVRAFYTYSSNPLIKHTVTFDHIDIIDSNLNGIYNENGNLIVSNCAISDTVDGLYGAIWSDGDLIVSNCTFSNNQSMDDESISGGAIYVYPSASITNSTFINNSTSGHGGAIFGAGNIEVINSTFEGNTAGISGGAVYAYAGSISNSTFIGNTAEQTGSGVNIWLTVDLMNNTFYNNSTTENNGGTITVASETGFTSSIINNTLDSNTGGGVRILPNVSVVLSNNILANNINGDDCFSAEDAQITGSNNIIVNNAASPNSCGIPAITDDPQLGPLADNGGPTQTMALLPGSPAIDAGDDGACPETDQRGVERPQRIHCDIGAYEKIIPTVSSIIRSDQNPTAASSAGFTVSFSHSVSGVDITDFTLTTSGVTGASITGVSGSEDTYTITVNTGSGNGSIRLDLIDDDSIEDLSGNKLGDSGTGNGTFTSGEFYTVFKLPPKPVGIPRLSLPRRNSITNDTTPTFNWTNVVNAQDYEIVIATDSAFTQVVLTETVSSPTFSLAVPLDDGRYFWRVRAFNSAAQPGRFSRAQAFTIDTTAPNIPTLTSPMDTASLRSTPVFRWSRVAGAVLYEFQYDNDDNFSSPTYSALLRTNYRRPPAMPNGTHYWRVRARDAAGNWSEWSPAFTVTISQ